MASEVGPRIWLPPVKSGHAWRLEWGATGRWARAMCCVCEVLIGNNRPVVMIREVDRGARGWLCTHCGDAYQRLTGRLAR